MPRIHNPRERTIHTPQASISAFQLIAMIWLVVGTAPALASLPEAGMRRLNVAVYGKDGKAVSNLGSGDFTVLAEGKPFPIVKIQGPRTPLRMIILIDRSWSMATGFASVRDALLDLIPRMGPSDEISIITFAEGVVLDTEFTSSPDRLNNSLRSMGLAGNRADRTVLYDAVQICLDRLQEQTTHRTALIVATDGKDRGSQETRQGEVLAASGAACVAIYPIRVLSRKSEFLDGLAANSGGEAFAADEISSQRLDGLARHLRDHYSLICRAERESSGRRTQPPVEVQCSAGLTLSLPSAYRQAFP